MVIGAFVLARLLGLRLLTLEAEVVVHDDDRAAAGSGPLVMTQLTPDPRRCPRPGRSGLCAPCALRAQCRRTGRGCRAADPARWPVRFSWWSRAPIRLNGPGGASTEADQAWQAPAQA